MASINVNDLPLAELKRLQKEIARAIETHDNRHKQSALAAIEEKAKEFGFALAELFSHVTSRKVTHAKAAPKYANPSDPTMTWSGRGRRPAWFVDATAKGRSAASMEI